MSVLDKGGLFVTGTDTDVGKTVVTGLLARMFKEDGLDIGIWKPLQSGHELTHPDGDVMRLRKMASLTDDPAVMCLRAAAEPLAPSLALSRQGIVVTRQDLSDHLAAYKRLRANILVEGAGGLCVPLTADTTVADLACQIGWPLVIVARPSLGTVNHTSLTVSYARSRGLSVLGVVISGMPAGDDRIEWANVPMIEELAECPVLAVLPRFDQGTSTAERVQILRREWER